MKCTNGEGGIRTRGTVSRTQHFQCCTFGHSVTSPESGNHTQTRGAREGEVIAAERVVAMNSWRVRLERVGCVDQAGVFRQDQLRLGQRLLAARDLAERA
jgi:hypothetical protein